MVATRLSTTFSSAIPNLSWPLGPDSSPPLFFESLDELKGRRQPGGSPLEPWLVDLPGTVDSLFPLPTSLGENGDILDRRHFGLISMGLVLIGHGFTDECHDLVTPLSWPDDIHFAHGPSVYSQVSSSAKAFATYTHSLVHRREAFHVGEFGMVGFGNANFWSNAVQRSSGVDTLPHQELGAAVLHVANGFRTSPRVREWYEKHGFTPESINDSSFYFESRAVHQLCAAVLQEGGTEDVSFREFAEQVVAAELKVLLVHALQRAGYTFHYDDNGNTVLDDEHDGTTTSSTPTTDASAMISEDIALVAARKVSSAHLQNFEASGYIILRRVAVVVDGGSDEESVAAFSAMAGIACQLLKSPACKLSNPSSSLKGNVPALQIRMPTWDDPGSDLVAGDCLAQFIPKNSNGTIESSGQRDAACFVFVFEPCHKNDAEAVFVNRLFGSRGETPTTVVQWSKGTIF